LVIEPKEPVPPTELEVKRTVPTEAGFRLPYESFVVRVTVIEEPEATEALEAVTMLWAAETAAGATVMTEEHAEVSPVEVAFR